MSEAIVSVLIVVMIALFIGVVKIVISTKRREGNLGVNLSVVVCPNCGSELPKTRKPSNLQETLWGGWTCNSCGAQCDKWGNLRKGANVNKTEQRETHAEKEINTSKD